MNERLCKNSVEKAQDEKNFFELFKIYKKNLKCEFIAMQSFKFPLQLRKRLFLAAQNEKTVAEVSNLNHDLGRFYQECFLKLKKPTLN